MSNPNMNLGAAPDGPLEGSLARRAADAIKALYASGFVDGLIARTRRNFGRLPAQSAEDVVAEAIAALYDALARDERVRNHEAWVLKAAHYLAIAEDERLQRAMPSSEPRADAFEDEGPEEGQPVAREDMRRIALNIARRLLPRLGQDKVVKVMKVYLEAVENGVMDVPSAEIAEMLDMTAVNVRKARERGFKRLERIAREEGLMVNLSELVTQDDEEADDDDEED